MLLKRRASNFVGLALSNLLLLFEIKDEVKLGKIACLTFVLVFLSLLNVIKFNIRVSFLVFAVSVPIIHFRLQSDNVSVLGIVLSSIIVSISLINYFFCSDSGSGSITSKIEVLDTPEAGFLISDEDVEVYILPEGSDVEEIKELVKQVSKVSNEGY